MPLSLNGCQVGWQVVAWAVAGWRRSAWRLLSSPVRRCVLVWLVRRCRWRAGRHCRGQGPGATRLGVVPGSTGPGPVSPPWRRVPRPYSRQSSRRRSRPPGPPGRRCTAGVGSLRCAAGRPVGLLARYPGTFMFRATDQARCHRPLPFNPLAWGAAERLVAGEMLTQRGELVEQSFGDITNASVECTCPWAISSGVGGLSSGGPSVPQGRSAQISSAATSWPPRHDQCCSQACSSCTPHCSPRCLSWETSAQPGLAAPPRRSFGPVRDQCTRLRSWAEAATGR